MAQSYGVPAQGGQVAWAIRFRWLSGEESWAGYIGYPTFVNSFSDDNALIFADPDDANDYIYSVFGHVWQFARIERCQLGKAE